MISFLVPPGRHALQHRRRPAARATSTARPCRPPASPELLRRLDGPGRALRRAPGRPDALEVPRGLRHARQLHLHAHQHPPDGGVRLDLPVHADAAAPASPSPARPPRSTSCPTASGRCIRLAYRNFGTHESLVTNQSVEAAANMAGIRWYEIRDPNGAPTIFQQGTYAPGVTDGIHRWMGSIAMDSAGNMALGYSASNATTTFPSSWYTGRLAGDPLGTMPQGEASIINGTGSQTGGSHRWGDYTSHERRPDGRLHVLVRQRVLPQRPPSARGGCASARSSSRAAGLAATAFKGPSPQFGGGPLAGVTVTPSSGPSTTTERRRPVPARPAGPGTYDVTFTKAGYWPQTFSGIVVPAVRHRHPGRRVHARRRWPRSSPSATSRWWRATPAPPTPCSPSRSRSRPGPR